MKATVVLTWALLLGMTGCAAPSRVVEINPGVYSLSVGAMGIEGGEAAARNKALADAAAYCGAHSGGQLNVQNAESKGPADWGSAAGSATVVFRCGVP
jgi:hypothetical protein